MNLTEEQLARLKEIGIDIEKVIDAIKPKDGEEPDEKELEEAERKLNALIEERDAIYAEAESREKIAEKRAALEQRAIQDSKNEKNVVARFKDEAKNMDNFTAKSPEYRSAYLKKLNPNLGALTEIEERAYTHMTTNTEAVMPEEMSEKIWDAVDSKYALFNDVSVKRFNGVYKFAKRTGITAGDAAIHTEAAAIVEEQNAFEEVQVVAKSFVKNVRISEELKATSIADFENWLIQEIAARIGFAINKYIIERIQAGIDAANKLSAKAAVPTYAEVVSAVGALETDGTPVIYGKRSVVYSALVGAMDSTGRPIFEHNAIDGVAGTILGIPVKIDESVPADVLLVGATSDIEANMPMDISVETGKDLTNRTIIYSGMAMIGAELANTKGFAQLTLTQSV